jgi:hypothetical protein
VTAGEGNLGVLSKFCTDKVRFSQRNCFRTQHSVPTSADVDLVPGLLQEQDRNCGR